MLKLVLHYRPDAVGPRPWQLTLREPGQPAAPVPPERSLIDLFTDSGRSLLILGEPGSGKTITMLQLAETLIEMARQDAAAPAPIILNLSSWAQAQKPMGEWMAEELFVQYGLARDLTRAAIAQNQFLYLLDGLDEVVTNARADCLTAINTFKEAHPAEMVVCSRVAEYEALQERLRMGAAIQIQPLSDAQIDAYLAQEGLELQATRATLRRDPDLRDLARAPLMLNLMALAYRGLTPSDLQPLADKAARRRRLFDHYVQRMFARRPLPPDVPYTQTQATCWLVNLAHGMAQHEQSVFYIDLLQPTWLQNNHLYYYYQPIVGILVGFPVVVLFGVVDVLLDSLLVGLFLGFVVGLKSKSIKLVEKLTWHFPSWQDVRSLIKILLSGGVGTGLAAKLSSGLTESFLDGLILGLLFTLSSLFFLGLLDVLTNGLLEEMFGGSSVWPNRLIRQSEVLQSVSPNQRIRQSAWNSLHMSLLSGLIWGVLSYLSNKLFHGPLFGYIDEISISWVPPIFWGLLVGLAYGGLTVIQHYTLRWLLAWAGVLPYPFRDSRLVALLDAMHERILLRRVGGGWVFVHRSLLEYFASLSPNAS